MHTSKILDLFDTLLGKFQFFRQYIKILISMDEAIEFQKTQMSVVYTDISILRDKIEKQEARIKDLEEQIDGVESGKSLSPNMKTSHSILESYQNLYKDNS